jgi:hypothetical protein
MLFIFDEMDETVRNWYVLVEEGVPVIRLLVAERGCTLLWRSMRNGSKCKGLRSLF